MYDSCWQHELNRLAVRSCISCQKKCFSFTMKPSYIPTAVYCKSKKVAVIRANTLSAGSFFCFHMKVINPHQLHCNILQSLWCLNELYWSQNGLFIEDWNISFLQWQIWFCNCLLSLTAQTSYPQLSELWNNYVIKTFQYLSQLPWYLVITGDGFTSGNEPAGGARIKTVCWWRREGGWPGFDLYPCSSVACAASTVTQTWSADDPSHHYRAACTDVG